MQSIEQSTDVGEDVIEMKEIKLTDIKSNHPPGHSLIFGDLFGMKPSFKPQKKEALTEQMRWIQSPSECLIYICELLLHETVVFFSR